MLLIPTRQSHNYLFYWFHNNLFQNWTSLALVLRIWNSLLWPGVQSQHESSFNSLYFGSCCHLFAKPVGLIVAFFKYLTFQLFVHTDNFFCNQRRGTQLSLTNLLDILTILGWLTSSWPDFSFYPWIKFWLRQLFWLRSQALNSPRHQLVWTPIAPFINTFLSIPPSPPPPPIYWKRTGVFKIPN